MSPFDIMAHVVSRFTEWLDLALETMGAVTIAFGAGAAVWQVVHQARAHQEIKFASMRFVLARYLALALEFQLAADVLTTGISPDWTKIGQLAAIATIRTGLNHFLTKEITEEREELASPAS